MELSTWQDQISMWYEHRKNDQVGKLEQAACQVSTDIEIKDWCLKRLQHLTVLALEFCNQQCDQSEWQQQAHSLIESHVALMRSLNWNETRKHDQGLRH
ncbi:hypothetical protein ACKVMY_04490 [Vibrio natriegens]|uniref:hypothetical protein n=1 Tax=Vibrio natriegens TaxID=691 RepID=UPI003DA13847